MLSPVGVWALLTFALVVDWIQVGPDWLRSRVAFLGGLVAIRVGWDESPIDRWITGFAGGAVDIARATGGGGIAPATPVTVPGSLPVPGAAPSGAPLPTPDTGLSTDTRLMLGVLVAMLALYCLGCLLPSRLSGKLGGWAQLAFSGKGGGGKYRLTWRLWVCAALLGITCDLPGGIAGATIRGAVDTLTAAVAPWIAVLFGGG